MRACTCLCSVGVYMCEHAYVAMCIKIYKKQELIGTVAAAALRHL